MISVCDAVIAAQNAVTAAQSFGIGSCYIGDIMENIEEQREILSLPPCVFPVAMVVFGYPTQQQLQRKKPKRVDMKYIVKFLFKIICFIINDLNYVLKMYYLKTIEVI
jgi:nitroreductase